MTLDEIREREKRDIKPCPFCGGEASVGKITYGASCVEENKWKQATFYFVNCTVCGSDSKGLIGSHSETEAINKWNTRTDIPFLLSLVERMGGCLFKMGRITVKDFRPPDDEYWNVYSKANAILKEIEHD